MESITHLINSIESFSKQNFKFSQYFQALNLLGKIPDTVSYRLNNIDVFIILKRLQNTLIGLTASLRIR